MNGGTGSQPTPPNRIIEAKRIFLELEPMGLAQREESLARACGDDHELCSLVRLLLDGAEAPLPFESLADDIRAANELPTPARRTIDAARSITTSVGGGGEDDGDRIGNYRLLERIGEGGFGVVFMAEQERPVRRRVALKIIKLGMDTEQVVARFEAERQALALMDHPGIAKVFDAGSTSTGRPYFVMELVRGQPITDYCDRKKLTIRQRLELMSQVCDALQHAHQKGVIHRDIKPSNVLVSDEGGGDRAVPKVIDFGIAKATVARLTERTIFTEFRQMIGTPEYMSPEQAGESSEDVDTRTDVYSAGVLLYELLTGATPFDSRRLRSAAYGEMQRIIREEEPPRPSTRLTRRPDAIDSVASARAMNPARLHTAIRGELDWIVMKAMEKDRARRYDSAGSMAADMRRYLTGHAVHAAPPSRAYRAQKFCRRNRPAVIAASIVVLVLVVGLLGTSYAMLRSIEAERKEASERRRAERAGLAQATQRTIAQKRAEEAEYESYVANIGLASSAAESGETRRGRAALAACPERLRGWEWRYLAARFDSSLRELEERDHPGMYGKSIDCSPRDGRLVISWQVDRSADGWGARIVDAGTFAPRVAMRGHRAPVTGVRFSPDGARVVTASEDMTARVFDAQTGSELAVLRGHQAPLSGASFAPDARTVITIAEQDFSVRRWDAQTGALVSTYSNREATMYSAEPLPGSSNILLTQGFDEPRVLDPALGRLIETPILPANASGVGANLAVASPDGGLIATSVGAGLGATIDMTSGRIRTFLRGHSIMIAALRFSPDGARVFTAGEDATARMWNPATGEPLRIFMGHSGPVHALAISPDASVLYTAADGSIRAWDATDSGRSFVLDIGRKQARFLSFSPDGTRFAVCADDGKVRIVDTATRSRIMVCDHTSPALQVRFTPDGKRLLVACFNENVKVLDAQSGVILATLPCQGAIFNVAVSPDGTRIAATASEGMAWLWDAGTFELIAPLDLPETATALAFTPDSSTVIVCVGGRLMRWRAHDAGRLSPSTFTQTDATCIAFARDGRMVLASEDGTATIVRPAPDASAPLTGSNREAPIVLRGHAGPLRSAAFSPDSARVATTGLDGTVRVWDPTTGRELLVIRCDASFLNTVVFSVDGRSIAVAGGTNRVQFFDAYPRREDEP